MVYKRLLCFCHKGHHTAKGHICLVLSNIKGTQSLMVYYCSQLLFFVKICSGSCLPTPIQCCSCCKVNLDLICWSLLHSCTGQRQCVQSNYHGCQLLRFVVVYNISACNFSLNYVT